MTTEPAIVKGIGNIFELDKVLLRFCVVLFVVVLVVLLLPDTTTQEVPLEV